MEDDDSQDSRYYWTEWFLSLKGSEFFCEIDEDFILDRYACPLLFTSPRFNLTGLNTEVPQYALAYDLITDSMENDIEDDSVRLQVEKSARHLYGLIHARYILTTRGMNKMKEKYKNSDFGTCPRVMCQNHRVLPVGNSDNVGLMSVKLYCPRCEDVYIPPNKRHQSTDGAYFGTSFPHFMMQVFSDLMLVPEEERMQRYIPKIFGFKIHTTSLEQRKQDEIREEQQRRSDMDSRITFPKTRKTSRRSRIKEDGLQELSTVPQHDTAPSLKSQEETLHQFDWDSAYGPHFGMSRMDRWKRAESLGLNPPRRVLELLQADDKVANPVLDLEL
ncbi:MAG: hypothetical protein SGCHY_001594 [Lobulomycetales sp.]